MPPELDLGLILIIFACVIAGFIVGAGLTYAWSRRQRRRLAAAPTPPPILETPAAPPAPAAVEDTAPKRVPLVELWREPSSGGLRLELEGRSYPSAADLNTHQRAQMVEILRQLVAWMGLQPAKPAAPAQPAPAAQPTRQPAPAASPVLASTPAIPDAEKKSTFRPRSMVEEVDEILAEMQAGLPPSANRVKLMGDLTRGIVVWVGLDHYDGIDNVPDENTRQLVRRAVAEWERRAG